jgi:hypothetical protein
MERIEDEVLRDLHITASTEGGMIRVVADALEDAAIDEEAFLDRIAVESGGLRGLFGKLGSLWSRAKQLLGGSPQAPPTLRSAVIPPAPPPQLGAGSPSTPRPPTAEQKQLANWLTGGSCPARHPSVMRRRRFGRGPIRVHRKPAAGGARRRMHSKPCSKRPSRWICSRHPHPYSPEWHCGEPFRRSPACPVRYADR